MTYTNEMGESWVEGA